MISVTDIKISDTNNGDVFSEDATVLFFFYPPGHIKNEL